MQELAKRKKREAGDRVGIAAPQAARFRAQPKQPLEPVSLHPQWRLTLRSCQEVERSPDANHDGRLDAPEMRCHPEFLLRRAQPYPYDVGPRRVDRVNGDLILLCRQRAEGRAIGARYLEVRVSSRQDLL